MLFDIIRIVLWLILSAGAVFLIKKSRIGRKKFASFLAVVLFAAAISLSAMFPLENLFVNFESPERVFHYTNSGKMDEIICGQDSCLVVYTKENSTCGHYIIPRTAKGYKIPNFFAIKKVSHQLDENGLFDVYNVKGTKDYYVFATVHLQEENEIEIFNEMGGKIESNIVRVENTSFIYFFLPDFSGEYCLSINGEKILLSGQ